MIYRTYTKAVLGLCITIMSCSALGNSSDILTIPEGHWEGTQVSAGKIAEKIVEDFNSINRVSNVQFKDTTHFIEVASYGVLDAFQVSFTAHTTAGVQQITCQVRDVHREDGIQINFKNCKNDDVQLKRDLIISIYEIAVNPDDIFID